MHSDYGALLSIDIAEFFFVILGEFTMLELAETVKEVSSDLPYFGISHQWGCNPLSYYRHKPFLDNRFGKEYTEGNKVLKKKTKNNEADK